VARFSAFALVALSATPFAQRIELTQGLTRLGFAGDVVTWTFAGERRALFTVSHAFGEALCTVTLEARPALARLSEPEAMEIDPALSLDARGEHVVFRQRRSGEDTYRLFIARSDGTEAARELPLPMLPGGVARSVLDPSGTWVLYLFGPRRREHLYAVRADGTALPRELNPPLANDREVTDFAFVTSPSGPRALYRADVLRNAWYELFAAPLDGSGPSVRLNDALAPHGDVRAFTASPDGRAVAYLAEENATDVTELYVTASDGSGPPRAVSPTPVAEGDVTQARFTPDGAALVFLGDLVSDEVVELFAAALDGSRPARRISSELCSGGDVLDFAFAGGARVLYRADGRSDGLVELYGVDWGGSGTAERLSASLPRGSVGVYEATPDARGVLFTAESAAPGAFELFVTPLRRTGAGRGASLAEPRALAPGLLLARDESLAPFVAHPDGAWVLLRARRTLFDAPELFLAPMRGTAKPVWGDGSASDGVFDVRCTADGSRVVSRGPRNASGDVGLYLRLFGRS
jgi:hypothetical protein